jgi:hypothetical protein
MQGLLRCRPRGHKVHRAIIREALFRESPPGIIFAPRRRPAVIVWLHTADQIRLPSAVHEPQFPCTPGHGTGIMWFAMGDEHHAMALLSKNNGCGIFSALLIFPGNRSEPLHHRSPPSLYLIYTKACPSLCRPRNSAAYCLRCHRLLCPLLYVCR